MTTRARRRRRRLFRTGHAYADIAELLSDVEPKGRCLDLPAGAGVNIDGIKAAGFEPVAADLYPEKAAGNGLECARVDFTEPLPFEDACFAAALCSEGIEHCPSQQQLICEFARVLKPGGTLLITTPNVLNLRARLAFMLNGHDAFTGRPINEETKVRGRSRGQLWPGHVYLVSYFVLRFMLRTSGFRRIRATSAKYSPTALCLAPFLWLPVRLGTGWLLRNLDKRDLPVLAADMASHVMCADMLFGKKLILLAEKQFV